MFPVLSAREHVTIRTPSDPPGSGSDELHNSEDDEPRSPERSVKCSPQPSPELSWVCLGQM
eukprot:scaffold11463_cov124-Isochrysis_galbana.AAC.5